jgi:hypothetical protein
MGKKKTEVKMGAHRKWVEERLRGLVGKSGAIVFLLRKTPKGGCSYHPVERIPADARKRMVKGGRLFVMRPGKVGVYDELDLAHNKIDLGSGLAQEPVVVLGKKPPVASSPVSSSHPIGGQKITSDDQMSMVETFNRETACEPRTSTISKKATVVASAKDRSSGVTCATANGMFYRVVVIKGKKRYVEVEEGYVGTMYRRTGEGKARRYVEA